MHKYKILFFSVLVFLAACTKDKTPEGIIKQEQMTSLLTQIHIVDGGLYNVTQMPDSLYKYGTARYLEVFKKFHTNTAQFNKSYKYYTAHPEMLETIYEQIIINLQQKTDSLNKLNQKQIIKDNQRRVDSLKKLPKGAVKKTEDSLKRNKPAPNHRISY
jgi:hypothetical protein